MNNKGTGMNDIQNERQTRKFTVFLLSFISLMVFSCARMGSPDGGWYDDGSQLGSGKG